MRMLQWLMMVLVVGGLTGMLTASEAPLSQEQADALAQSTGPLSAEQVNQAVPYLQANAKAYEENELLPYPQLKSWLTDVKVDNASAQAVADAIGKVRDPMEQMYITGELLVPFLYEDDRMATREQALPLLKPLSLIVQHNHYKKLPPLSEAAARQLQMPEGDLAGKASSEKVMKEIARVQRTREQKLKRELPILVNNELLWTLEKAMYRMRVLAAQEKDARKLAIETVKLERAGNGIYFNILRSVATAVERGRLASDDAATYYDIFVQAYQTLPTEGAPNVTGDLIRYHKDKPSEAISEGGANREQTYRSEINRIAAKTGKPTLPEP